MDDDVEEGKNARLSATVDVTGAEGHCAIREGSGLELGVAIGHIRSGHGLRLRQDTTDVQLHDVSFFRRLNAASSEDDAHGGSVVVGDVVRATQSVVTAIGQIDDRTAWCEIVDHREGGRRAAAVAVDVGHRKGYRFCAGASATVAQARAVVRPSVNAAVVGRGGATISRNPGTKGCTFVAISLVGHAF